MGEPSDIVKFFKDYVPKAATADKLHKFVGDKGVGMSGIEAALDVDYIMGVAPGLLTEFWQGNISQLGCKPAEVTATDVNLAKLAAKGISIIIASGDSGSGYSPFPGDDHKKLPKLYPSWPASSPWVTAVGSTRFIKQSVTQPEMATDQFGSGGGFSTEFDQFKEQASAVAQYLKVAKDLPPAGSFPPTGRATPDVSALGEGFQVIAGGQVQSVGGTSASTPTFASLVGLLNEARLKAGKPAMGHLNPFLYQNPDAFTDITV